MSSRRCSRPGRSRARRPPPAPESIGAVEALLTIRLTPRAARERLVAGADGAFAAHVTAPPVDGAANDALCRLVAKAAGVPPPRVGGGGGARARREGVGVEGLDEVSARARIGASFPPAPR